jgi:hypothetical protein
VKEGNGLKSPVSGSGSDMTLGGMRLLRKLPFDLCRTLCALCGGC